MTSTISLPIYASILDNAYEYRIAVSFNCLYILDSNNKVVEAIIVGKDK